MDPCGAYQRQCGLIWKTTITGHMTVVFAGLVTLGLVAGCTSHNNGGGGENGPGDLSNDDLRGALPSLDEVDDVVPLVETERYSDCIPEFDQEAKDLGRRTLWN